MGRRLLRSAAAKSLALALPEDATKVAESVDRVLAEALYWFPVRHHSPGVAKRVREAILTRRPKLIFLEAPEEAEHLVAHIVDGKTKPPIAIYSSFRDDHPRSFKAWSQAISRNIVRRHLGRRQHTSWQALPEGVGEPADRREGPQSCASLQEERASLTRAYNLLLVFYGAAFQELSERDRHALTLVEIEGKTYAEACEILGVGMSNMKMIMFRARKRIRARLDAALDHDPGVARKVG